MFNYYWPLGLIVLSNIFYNISSKSTPQNINPLASLTVTYLIASVCCFAIYYVTSGGTSIVGEWGKMNWTTVIMGLTVVGLEAGSIYMYKAGWPISIALLVHSSLAAIALVLIGIAVFHETVTVTKIAGVFVCLAGLYMINR